MSEPPIVNATSVDEFVEVALAHFSGFQWTANDRRTAAMFARALLAREVSAVILRDYYVDGKQRYGLSSGTREVGLGSFGLGLLADPADARAQPQLCIRADIGGQQAGDWIIWHDDTGHVAAYRAGTASPRRPVSEAPELLAVLIASVVDA